MKVVKITNTSIIFNNGYVIEVLQDEIYKEEEREVFISNVKRSLFFTKNKFNQTFKEKEFTVEVGTKKLTKFGIVTNPYWFSFGDKSERVYVDCIADCPCRVSLRFLKYNKVYSGEPIGNPILIFEEQIGKLDILKEERETFILGIYNSSFNGQNIIDMLTLLLRETNKWLQDRNLSREEQRKGFLKNVSEELTELKTALNVNDLYQVADALIDILVLFVNSLSNSQYEKFLQYLDREDDLNILDEMSDEHVDFLQSIKEKKDTNINSILLDEIECITMNTLAYIEEGGEEEEIYKRFLKLFIIFGGVIENFCFLIMDIVLSEVLKELHARKGRYNSRRKKWVKDKTRSSYKANYLLADYSKEDYIHSQAETKIPGVRLFKPKTKEELLELLKRDDILLDFIDTSLITDMSYLFAGTDREYFRGIAFWDTSNVTNMKGMFKGCSEFDEHLYWDVSKVTNMDEMFKDCINFNTELCLNTKNVTSMKDMFNGCTSFNKEILLDTKRVENMDGMFAGCINFNQETKFYTPKLKSSVDMIKDCKSLCKKFSKNIIRKHKGDK